MANTTAIQQTVSLAVPPVLSMMEPTELLSVVEPEVSEEQCKECHYIVSDYYVLTTPV